MGRTLLSDAVEVGVGVALAVDLGIAFFAQEDIALELVGHLDKRRDRAHVQALRVGYGERAPEGLAIHWQHT